MRSKLMFLTVFFVALLGAVALVGAQEGAEGDAEPGNDWVPVVPDEEYVPEFTVGNPTAVNPETGMVLNLVPLSPEADILPGSDSCGTARLLSLIPLTVPAASQTNVASFTTAVDDPALSCIWGANPPSRQGYRTAWYQFKTDYNGLVTINTRTSDYDTILGVFTGTCGATSLQAVACNDDATGLTSSATFAVRRDVTYYVEVADWLPGALSITLLLNMQAAYERPLVSQWTNVGFMSAPTAPVSRHATAVVGTDIYVVGGFRANAALSSSFFRYQTATDQWIPLDNIPGPGFANTTAVYLGYIRNGTAYFQIHVPGGSNSAVDSATGAYTSDHWYYDLVNGGWHSAAAVPGTPFAYAAADSTPSGTMYVTGGTEGPGWPLDLVVTDTVRSEVLAYNPISNSWSSAGAMPEPRYGHTAAVVGNRICVAGGLRYNEGSTPAVALLPGGECASLSTPNSWAATGLMQVPRYFAHSDVGPDGRWYVYGGIAQNGEAVPEVEYYDPATNSWYLLNYEYDLNNRQPGDPALVWPGGGFVGEDLWTIGGSIDLSGASPYPLIKKMTPPPAGDYFFPIIMNGSGENFTFDTARYLPLNQAIGQNIASASDRYRFFQIRLPQATSIQLNLSVPSSANLDLFLYDNNKLKWGQSDLPFQGVAEQICLNNLQAGVYYLMVKHVFPNVPDSSQNFVVSALPVAHCP